MLSIQPALFAGVDRAVFVATFAARLRAAGMAVFPTSTQRYAVALGAVGPLTVHRLYWSGRISFVHAPGQIDLYDRVFAAVFDMPAGVAPRDRGQHTALRLGTDDLLVSLEVSKETSVEQDAQLPWATLPSYSFDAPSREEGPSDDDAALPELRPSLQAADIDRPFDTLDEAALDRVCQLLESMMDVWPTRKSRRQSRSPSQGQIELRRSIREAMKTGGEVVRFARCKPRHRPRPVVAILDVSGSMEGYAQPYLSLLRPLAIRHNAEVFMLATELTRVTPALRMSGSSDAIRKMSQQVGDRFSGTRLASSLRALLVHRSWSTVLRGAVVLICSDGWDADHPADLDKVMRRISRLAHRTVWVNPRSAAPGFEPLVGGMSAALPHCDSFLAGNNARSIAAVVSAISES